MTAGAVVFDCRPAVLPVSVDVSGIDIQTVRATAEPPAEPVVAPTEREQESTGPMWLNDIDPELEVTPLLDSGSYCQDESARLLSRDPEYWVEHMGKEKTLSAALQLQHDAGLILSNVQILQQLVTALHGASANVMGAVRGHQPFPTQAMRHALPSGGDDRAAHYMTAKGLLRSPIAPGMRSLHVQRRLPPGDASASRGAKLD